MILKKIGIEYKLYEKDDSCVATTQESPYKRLSEENCDEIWGIDILNLLKEIEVDVEMENYVKYVPKSLETVYPTGGVRPRLDENKCLILKKK
jgi:hypothetical protein